jgi:hypothetical protein
MEEVDWRTRASASLLPTSLLWNVMERSTFTKIYIVFRHARILYHKLLLIKAVWWKVSNRFNWTRYQHRTGQPKTNAVLSFGSEIFRVNILSSQPLKRNLHATLRWALKVKVKVTLEQAMKIGLSHGNGKGKGKGHPRTGHEDRSEPWEW